MEEAPEAEEDPKAVPEGSDAHESTKEGPKVGPEVSVEEEDPKMVAPQITCDELVGKK